MNEDDYMRMLMSSINAMERPYPYQFQANAGDLYGGIAGDFKVDPDVVKQILGERPNSQELINQRFTVGANTPLGLLELSKSNEPYNEATRLRYNAEIPIGEGLLNFGAKGSVGGKERIGEIGYSTDVGGGNLSAKFQIGKDQYDQLMRQAQIQYLKQLDKDKAMSVYGGYGNRGMNVGLNYVGRF